MDFVLILTTCSAMFLPSSVTMTTFDTMENCEIALREAKREWSVVDNKSRCVDLKKSERIVEAQKALEKAINGK